MNHLSTKNKNTNNNINNIKSINDLKKRHLNIKIFYQHERKYAAKLVIKLRLHRNDP